MIARRHGLGLVAALGLATLSAMALAVPSGPDGRASFVTREELSAAARTPLPDSPYQEAAASSRRGELAGADRALAPIVARGGIEAGRARAVLGLLSYCAGDCARARSWFDGGTAGSDLEDWRLYAEAECAAGGAVTAEARAALETLLSDNPESPLRNLAIVRLAEISWSAADPARALHWIERGRASALQPSDAAKLDTLAWTIGRATADFATVNEAARRLLVRAPLEASRLEVAAELTARGVDWKLLLGPAELVDRAESLLAVDVPLGALTTLEAIPASARAFRYHWLEARALVASGRGEAAESAITRMTPEGADQAARLEQVRAAALEERTVVRRGRPSLAAGERDRLRDEALAALARAIELAQDRALKLDLLRDLYARLDEQERIEEAIAVQRRIVALAPGDTLGARSLWQRGWREYVAGNGSGAIGYWRELTALYPAISYARSAAYWSARAFEKLGERERARAAYVEIARAPTVDFYARQAGLRLAGVPFPAALAPVEGPEAWPDDELLARASRLSEQGLDSLARIEVDALADRAEPRAVAALRGRTLARSGDWRESLRQLRTAFPRLATANQQSVPREALELYYPRPFDDRVQLFARAQNLPSSLVFGIVHQESGFDAAAKSRSGARGLMQLMPATARELSRNLRIPYSTQRLFEPDTSLRLGTTYFRQMLGMFDGRVELALASYNGGPGRIGRLWRAHGSSGDVDLFLEDLDIEEPRNYVKRILVLAESYRSLYSDLS